MIMYMYLYLSLQDVTNEKYRKVNLQNLGLKRSILTCESGMNLVCFGPAQWTLEYDKLENKYFIKSYGYTRSRNSDLVSGKWNTSMQKYVNFLDEFALFLRNFQ